MYGVAAGAGDSIQKREEIPNNANINNVMKNNDEGKEQQMMDLMLNTPRGMEDEVKMVGIDSAGKGQGDGEGEGRKDDMQINNVY